MSCLATVDGPLRFKAYTSQPTCMCWEPIHRKSEAKASAVKIGGCKPNLENIPKCLGKPLNVSIPLHTWWCHQVDGLPSKNQANDLMNSMNHQGQQQLSGIKGAPVALLFAKTPCVFPSTENPFQSDLSIQTCCRQSPDHRHDSIMSIPVYGLQNVTIWWYWYAFNNMAHYVIIMATMIYVSDKTTWWASFADGGAFANQSAIKAVDETMIIRESPSQ